jgi:hypothetical protein
MTDLMEEALAAAGRWPASEQDEAAELLLALEANSRPTPKSKRRFAAFVGESSL